MDSGWGVAVRLGILHPTRRDGQIVMLQVAELCQDCDAISSGYGGVCARCGSLSLLALAPVLNRELVNSAPARKGENRG